MDFINNNLFCDEKCQKDKKGLELYDDYIKLKNQSETLPQHLENAERKYILFDKGGVYYKNYLKNNASNKVKGKVIELEKKFTREFQDLEILNNGYKSQKIYLENVNTLLSKLKNNYNILKNKLSKVEDKTNVNHRLQEYEEDVIHNYSNKMFYIKLLYYLILSLFVAYKILYKNKLTSKIHIISTIVLLSLPLLI
mgnify:CR=1 FL=1